MWGDSRVCLYSQSQHSQDRLLLWELIQVLSVSSSSLQILKSLTSPASVPDYCKTAICAGSVQHHFSAVPHKIFLAFAEPKSWRGVRGGTCFLAESPGVKARTTKGSGNPHEAAFPWPCFRRLVVTDWS